MENFIHFILSNFTLTFFVIGLIFSAFVICKNRKSLTKAFIIESIFKYYCFWVHGICWIYNGIMHTVFHEMAAGFIGWEDSPFQMEVGYASLGFGLVGLLAIRNDFGLRLALVISTSVFLLGAAGGHIYEIIAFQNYASGNAGIMLWSDILLPIISVILLYFSFRYRKATPNQTYYEKVG